jgi:hypothetical protein
VLAVTLIFGATALHGFVPQTIVVDGANDFLVANLMDPDSTDAQFPEIDMDSVFVTNDANKLYIGIQYSKGAWTSNQVGIHISADGDTNGGTTDSWGRAISWNSAPHKPDYQAYSNLDNSWQELRKWNAGGGTWDVVYAGINSLGWVNNTGFEEVGLNLSDLGVSLGDTIWIEIVVTQDGGTKGPLDAMANDDQQLSTPTSTTWDVAQPVNLDDMLMYVVQLTGDSDPPTVSSTRAVIDASLDASNRIEVVFSEPVDQTTAETPGNYSLGGTAAAIDSVRRNLSFPDRVTIYLDSQLTPQASFHSVTVTNVEDLNSNVIVANDTTNVGCFFLKCLRIEADMGFHLMSHTAGTDTVSVEGGLAPLTWTPCDNALMTDTGGDIFVDEIYFSLPGTGCPTGSPSASANLEWKLNHQCAEYETIANRQHTLSSTTGAKDTLKVFWDDMDPSQFTMGPVDVIFTVDGNSKSPTVDSTMSINGSMLPLTFDIPSLNDMADDGVAPDLVASDGIYTKMVRFPAMSQKNVGYKYVYNDVYECGSEGNREVYLNDAEYDTLGGTKGPLVMPLQYYDRCSTIGRDVEVIFKLNALWQYPTTSDTLAVNGTPSNDVPETFNWNVPSLNPMRDDGVYPDDTAGDLVYAVSVVFPDSSNKYVEYKYLFNSSYECTTQANRYFYIDETYDASGNPQVLEVDHWNICVITAIGDTPHAPFILRQNVPNPFNPSTTITFSTEARGRAVVRIYDVRGALVTTLLDKVVGPGETRVAWDAKDRNGREMSSGVYFYDLQINGKRATRKMVLLR